MTGNRNGTTVTDYDEGIRVREAGEEYTIRRRHVGSGASVEDPGVGALKHYLVQGGNEAGLIPTTIAWLEAAGGVVALSKYCARVKAV